MATSKTLAPTGVTIQIPEFTDQPDQRVNSNCLDKIADAVNTVNSKIRAFLLTVTVNGGYFTISTSDVPSDYTPAVIQSVYSTGKPLNLVFTIDSNTYRTVYVRTGSGGDVANGTEIKVKVVCIKS